MRLDLKLAEIVGRWTGVAAPILFILSVPGGLLGRELRIIVPADGAVVHSGEAITVKVDAEPFAFQWVHIGTSLSVPTPPALPAASPPYEFKIQIPPNVSSGQHTISATGISKPGQADVVDVINIDVERPDLPQKLTVTFPSADFSYVGLSVRDSVLGEFADGSVVLLTDSAYTTYASDTPGVAKVDAQGDITAVGPGTAHVTVTYGNALLGTTSVQFPVNVPYPITVNPPRISIYASQSGHFSATVAIDPSLEQSVVWSTKPAVGSIDRTGLYTAPASVAARQRVTVTATSVADPRNNGSADVWILPRPKNR